MRLAVHLARMLAVVRAAHCRLQIMRLAVRIVRLAVRLKVRLAVRFSVPLAVRLDVRLEVRLAVRISMPLAVRLAVRLKVRLAVRMGVRLGLRLALRLAVRLAIQGAIRRTLSLSVRLGVLLARVPGVVQLARVPRVVHEALRPFLQRLVCVVATLLEDAGRIHANKAIRFVHVAHLRKLASARLVTCAVAVAGVLGVRSISVPLVRVRVTSPIRRALPIGRWRGVPVLRQVATGIRPVRVDLVRAFRRRPARRWSLGAVRGRAGLPLRATAAGLRRVPVGVCRRGSARPVGSGRVRVAGLLPAKTRRLRNMQRTKYPCRVRGEKCNAAIHLLSFRLPIH